MGAATDSIAATGTQVTVGTKEVQQLSREEAEAQGYTIIETAEQFNSEVKATGKYILMADIDFSAVSRSTKNLAAGAEFNGNGYAIKNVSGCVTIFDDNRGTIKNLNVTGANMDYRGVLVDDNYGTIENCSVEGYTKYYDTMGFIACRNNSGASILNCSADGTVDGRTGVGLLVGANSGTIKDSCANGLVKSSGGTAGGFVGSNSASGKIENCYATADVECRGNYSGGFIGTAYGTINNCYATGSVNGAGYSGGFVGLTQGVTITNSYAKGNLTTTKDAGGFVGHASSSNNLFSSCYSMGDVNCNGNNVGGFIGYANIVDGVTIENSYSSGTVNSTNTSAGAFIANNALDRVKSIDNCYANSSQASNVVIQQNGVTAVPANWFEESGNLMFLGDAYDYYYNPPELWTNARSHPEEYVQFQVGANSGVKNMLEMNLTFRMNFFSADVSTVEFASETLERVDKFKDMLVEKRAEIGSVRNRLDSVSESQSIRLENLSASHSTIVDTDFAQESASLVKSQILQNAANSLLKQANFTPNIALQLLS